MTVTGGAANLPAGLVTYSLIGGKPVFPLSANDVIGYRQPFPPAESWMTGPKCALTLTDNNCGLTAIGTQGYIAINGDDDSANNPTNVTTAPVATVAPGNDCPEVCWACPAGADPEADSNVSCCRMGNSDPVCGDYCSPYFYCGTSTIHVSNGVNCAGCVVTTQAPVPPNTGEVTGPPDNCSTQVWVSSRSEISDQTCQEICSTNIGYCDPDICVCQLQAPVVNPSSVNILMVTAVSLLLVLRF